jgi:beta-glucosidase
MGPGEARLVALPLNERSFSVYDVAAGGWRVDAGEYEIRVGFSSRDIVQRSEVTIASDEPASAQAAPSAPMVDDAEFAALLGRRVPTPRPTMPFHEDSTIGDLDGTWLGRRLRTILLKVAGRRVDVDDPVQSAMIEATIREMPLRGVVMAAGGQLTFAMLEKAIALLNAARRR